MIVEWVKRWLHWNRPDGPQGLVPRLLRATCCGLLRPVLGEIEHQPFPDRSFDAVIAVDVFEHLPPGIRARAFREMARVARRHVVARGALRLTVRA